MANETEEKFKRDLYGLYDQCKKYFIPKDDYFQTIEEINTAGQNPKRKTRQHFYLPSK